MLTIEIYFALFLFDVLPEMHWYSVTSGELSQGYTVASESKSKSHCH